MPAPVAPAEKRTSSSLTVLFWVGVGLAPLAALFILVADGGGSLRIGVVLAILAVVLIGLSIALRAESGDGAAGTEELRDEIEQLRHELRSEIVAAAHRGNEALDQAQRTQETVTALRRRLDAAAAGMAAAAGRPAPVAEQPPGDRARVPAAETYDEGRSRHRAAQEPAPTGGGRPAGWDEEERPRRQQPGARYDADRPQPGVYGASRAAEPDVRPEPRPVGVVHHTETVHVTTRHTIVDGGADPVAGTHYGGYAGRWSPVSEDRPGNGVDSQERPRPGYREPADDRDRSGGDHARPAHGGSWHGGSWSGPADERPRSGPADERSWSGPADERSWPAAAEGPADERWQPGSRDTRRDEQSWSAGRDGRRDDRAGRVAADDPDGDYWSELRAGNRWASVRDDERGREIRVGERHAAVQAAEAGTEYRVEDRWASVREPRRDHGAPRTAGPGWAEERRPELPAGGVPVPNDWRPPHSSHPDRRPDPAPPRYSDDPPRDAPPSRRSW
ncbi:hypothetical protein AB0C02_10050 [Micromonospora sp. NPDC048999]|uniref:hypothetical protein n=1 Tax=Micromonospora sp. NPDC048999 TaxID=3155391 RepID=UPI00340F6811